MKKEFSEKTIALDPDLLGYSSYCSRVAKHPCAMAGSVER